MSIPRRFVRFAGAALLAWPLIALGQPAAPNCPDMRGGPQHGMPRMGGDGGFPPPFWMPAGPPPGAPGGPGPQGGPPPDFAAIDVPPPLLGLDLTEEQRDRIFAILHAQAPAVRTAQKAQRKADEALRGIAWSADFDATRTAGLVDAASKAQAQLLTLRISGERQIREVLTDSQRKQLAQPVPGRGPQ